MNLKYFVQLRLYSKDTKSTKFFTTPVYYVNANPHIGHLYSSLIADAAQRWRKLFHKDVRIKFSTGTDEHGSKIQQAADKNNTLPSVYCERISSQFRKLANEFNVDYTCFVRTSDEIHKKTLTMFWNTLAKNGHIYRSVYEGYYCVSDETFLTDIQLKEIENTNGEKILVSLESGHSVEWTREENYMFKLSNFRDDLIHWLRTNESYIRPKKFYKILFHLLNSNESLPDLSVSRPASRVHWAIPVPEDNSQTIYVWLDALANYLTAAGYADNQAEFRKFWPPDLQVIGKDILKFHGIYWPAFLIAANLEPPRSIFCHSHWMVNGEKMSKSKGNVVCPFDRAGVYTNDGLRYFLLREGVSHSDGNYSDTKVMRILNSELADTIGNLLSRCTGNVLNPDQKFPKISQSAFDKVYEMDVTKKLIESVVALPATTRTHYEDLNFYKVADEVVKTVHVANLFFETAKPWELKKNPATLDELNVVLHVTLETLRIVGILLQPMIPELSDRLLNKINVDKEERYFSNLLDFSWNDAAFEGRNLGPEKVVLFKKIQLESENKTKQRSI